MSAEGGSNQRSNSSWLLISCKTVKYATTCIMKLQIHWRQMHRHN
jgi:uncharacterized membrane protein